MSYAAFFLLANPIGPAKPDPNGLTAVATGGDGGVDLCLEDLSSADRYENLSHGECQYETGSAHLLLQQPVATLL